MRTIKVLLLALSFVLPAFSAVPGGPTSIIVAPKAPRFTDAERHAELARRRAAVAAKLTDKSVLVLFSAEPRLYTNDVDYVYRQENDLFYLTALRQDGATFVMTKNGGSITETLFLPKRNPLREAWEGKMYSREQAMGISGLKDVADASEAEAFLAALKEKRAFTAAGGAAIPGGANDLYMLLPMSDADENGRREYRAEAEFVKGAGAYKVTNARPIFAELRQIKSPYELKVLQHAVDISTEAHMRAMATVGRADWEYEVHAELEYTFRRRNADFWGYPSIVGCGPNATTLHYVESQSPVRKGDLMLIDAAAEYDHYTADITRTYPVNGRFSKEQAEIYQIVFDAQEAVARATRPGVTFADLSAASDAVLRAGLAKLGLITAPDATYERTVGGRTIAAPQHKLWAIHGLGHWLGMNVHDVGSYGAPLKAGMVYTNEPGLYIREDALDNVPDTPANRALKEKLRAAFEKYKNIGVRIEDDMLVTETGVTWMSAKLPRTIADIEAFMAVAPKQVPLSHRLTFDQMHAFPANALAIR